MTPRRRTNRHAAASISALISANERVVVPRFSPEATKLANPAIAGSSCELEACRPSLSTTSGAARFSWTTTRIPFDSDICCNRIRDPTEVPGVQAMVAGPIIVIRLPG